MSLLSMNANQPLRAEILTNILHLLLLSHPQDCESDIASVHRALTLGSLIHSHGGQNNELLGGGLTGEDIRRFGLPARATIPSRIQDLILTELQSTIASISDFYYAGSAPNDAGSELRDNVEQMLRHIQTSEAEGDRVLNCIQQLIRDIQEINSSVQQRLTSALEKFPPELASRDSANTDLLSITIEASLVKISLIRAQVSQILYAPPMKKALTAAHARLKEENRVMEEEERQLDNELAEYQRLLDMVDGGDRGGFRQVLEDCAVVEKEMEECRRDLRRLGWTGEN